MTRSFPARRTALVAVLALTTALAAAGCAKKITTPDANRTKLEGVSSPDVRMIVWPEVPTEVFTISDTINGSRDPNGFHVSGSVTLPTPSTDLLHVQILDRTSAAKFDVFRRETNGSLTPQFDYSLSPVAKWLDTGWEAYRFTVSPARDNPNNSAWVARGIIGDVAGALSPLSNVSPWRGWSTRDQAPTLKFQSAREQADSSQVSITWTTDSNAAGYWLEVIPFDDVEELTLPNVCARYNEALPLLEPPLGRRALRRYIPAPNPPAATVSFNDPNAETITNKLTFFMHKSYIVRVAAVNAEGRVINRIQTDYRRWLKDTGHVYYPVGGVVFGTYTLQDRLQERGLKLGDLPGGYFLCDYDQLHSTGTRF